MNRSLLILQLVCYLLNDANGCDLYIVDKWPILGCKLACMTPAGKKMPSIMRIISPGLTAEFDQRTTLSAATVKIFGFLLYRYLGDRSAKEDISLKATGYLIFDAFASFRW